MAPLFGYCNKPSLGPWTRSPGTVPPSSCRYINSGAIIGLCAFSQSPLGPAAAPLSYSFCLCRFSSRLAHASIVYAPAHSLFFYLSFFPTAYSPSGPLLLSRSYPTSTSYFFISIFHLLLVIILCFFLLLRRNYLAHPLTRPPYPSESHPPPCCGSLHRP